MKQQSVLLLVLLLAASSSPYGELQGAGAYFSDDVICEDGSNEEFCVLLGQGSCDFEHHSCGWNDTSKTNYRWRLELANITTTPGQDHTTSSPWGHVMYVDGRYHGWPWPLMATLIHLVNKTGAIGCQISFWYHIHDDDTNPSESAFTLNMVRGSISEELRKIEKRKTTGWENATAFIGNQPGGYKLEFSFERPLFSSEVKDVMLDDIRFEYCEEGDIPAGSDQLSCNFTVNTCSWYHDHTASLMWKRSHKHMDGPEFDHTGNGYYMFIAAQKDPTSLARLMSLPQHPGRPGQSICVSFWYHIFGSSGSLKFITKRAGEETIVWMRSGTQGNKWRFADLTFTSDTPIQFIFEAVAGGQQGSIAIDDTQVVSSGSCPAERECTFQGSLCGLQPHPTTQFSWNRTRGAEMVNSSSPATDHTLGTEQGFYLSAQLWRHPMSSKVGMITALMEPTPASGECWMFWYHMEGNRVGELNIYLQTLQPHRTSEHLWTKSGDQGKHWRHGRVTVLSVDTPYQVIFEAVGDGSKGDIAIDDLTVQNGVCPPAGFCDFEMDYCGWVNSLSEGSGMAWDWLSASSEGSRFIPNKDHTTDSSLGHFVIFLAPKSDKVQISHLESEFMGAVDHACLELWHRTEGWIIGPSDIMLTVFVNETSGLRSVWSTHGYSNNTWHRARVDYNASGQHQIILEARGTNKTDGSLALDDIYIMANTGCTDTVPTTTPNPTSPTITTPSASFTDCTFEQGLCNWVQNTTDEINWDLLSGLQVDQPWDGPLYDHTMLNDQGSYLLLNGSGSKDGESAVISLPAQTSTLCVGFWHYMLGPSISSLDLLVRNTSSKWLVWNRRGSQDFEWMNAQVTINMRNIVEIMFSGHRDASSRGFISLDDVKVTEGVCSDQKVCGFESDLCDFEHDVSHGGHWDRQRGTKDRLDHTYGTEHGFYLTASQSPVAQLLTAELSPMEAMCIRFWYWLPAAPSDSLSVHLLRSGEQEAALWQRSGLPSTGWEVAELTVSSPIQFRVVFKAAHVPDSSNSTAQLDDVSMKNGACSPLGSCDFETGQCTWTNVPQQDGHDWVQADGRFQGPPIDHTTQTPEGKFLLSPSLVQGQSSRAQVVSEWIQVKDTSSCLILWYHTDNSESATLRVYVRSGPSEEELLFQTNRSGPSWTRFSESIVKTPFFQVLIEAHSINSGYVAIDDIAVTSGLCPVNETIGAFTGCSFENDTCGWEDMSAGQFKWLRGRNATDNAGPSLDHTLGTEYGWYMAVVEDRGPEGSAASLNSPTMQQASSTCTLHFYYHMYGGVQGELKVSLKQDSRDTLLWWQLGDQGDSWRRGEVAVGRTPDHFTIAFEATRTFIAIDDVDFSNCTLPEPQPRCPEDMFTCNNKVCVEHSRVCDFSDDCGDESDEIGCDQQGVRDRCSFEEGFCSWNAWMNWTHTSGETAWPDRGPPRDHTLNTAAGHFIIPGPAMTENGQMSEILSGTLLPSTNCTVRFYFYSLDDVIGALTVRSRTYQSGIGDTVLWLKGQTHSYSWQRAEVTLTSTTNSKIVFCYQQGNGTRGLVAVDDISLSKACELDPKDSQLPTLPPTSAPPTTALPPTSAPPTSTAAPTPSTPPSKPCKDNEFFCWQSEVCILATLQCDYHIDCPLGEDEDTCGPCTFENGQCQWNDTSEGPNRWQRQRATNDTCPPTDHTTDTGYYMGVNSSEVPSPEARLQSPTLPPSSPYCQIVFHFHISGESDRSLSVIMPQADGGEAILWSRSHNTASQWSEERLPLGQQQLPYKIFFISILHWPGPPHIGDHAAAVDDISFLNCETSFQPPALSAYGCSFEKNLCSWAQGTEDQIDWQRRSGPTETPDTGPAGDHTTGTGQYLYIESSLPSVKGNRAQIKSSLLPPAGEKGYCFSFWYHMFGATVGSLKMVLQTSNDVTKILVWQLSGSQGDEWRQAQRHVTLALVHQVILEASVGGEAGDIALDDITLTPGPCPASDVCDFEEGSCNWQQQTDDNSDWIRHWGPTPNPNTGPDSDHTTHTRTGHYYYVPSSVNDLTGQTARMASPLYPAGKGECVQLWYHMYGRGMGTLNVYQQNEDGQKALLFSQAGDQGRLWRFAQASLVQNVKPYRIVVEGVKMAASTPVMTEEGDVAFDDVRVSDSPWTSPAFCDFESSLCGWSNVGGGVDQGDWLRGRGRDARPDTGPAVDHTTNSEQGYYLHVDNSLGQLGDQSFLISDLFQPATRGSCLTFWYHMYGSHVGTLNVYVFDRKTLTSGGGDGKAMLKWTETGDKGSRWQRANVSVDHDQPFWLVFVYQRKMDSGWKVALDDITILPVSCYSPPPPPIDPPHNNDHALVIGLVVGFGLLAGIGCMLVLSVYRRCFNTHIGRHQSMADESIVQNAVFDLYDCKIDGTQHGSESSLSFYNNLYDSSSVTETPVDTSAA